MLCNDMGWKRSTLLRLAFLAVIGVHGAIAMAQASEPVTPPAETAPTPPSGGPNAAPGSERPRDGRIVREQLARMLEENQRIAKELADLQNALDGGASPIDVGRRLGEIRREAVRRGGAGRAGGEDRDGPEDRPGPGGAGRPQGGGGPQPQGRPPMEERATFDIPPLGGGPRLSDEERQRVATILAEVNPAGAAKLDELGSRDSRARERLLDGLGNRLRGMEAMRDRDPKEFQLRVDEMVGVMEIMRHGRAYTELARSGADDEKLAPARQAMREAIDQQFDRRLAILRHQLMRSKERTQRFEQDIDSTASNRSKIVEDKTGAMLKSLQRRREGEKPPQGGAPEGR